MRMASNHKPGQTSREHGPEWSMEEVLTQYIPRGCYFSLFAFLAHNRNEVLNLVVTA